MARLTDQERQEIVRYLEAGRPLPDKYRFLLFEDKREVELVWNGKTQDVSHVVLPFQVIEQVDEPRAETDMSLQLSLFDMDDRGRQLQGWTNKLIWGDNKLILSSLKNGPLRAEIERQGGIKFIYIDPPFDVGADFSIDIEIGDDTFTKKPSVLEEIAYRDTWGKGTDSFISMIHERLVLMRDLLAEDGSIYVHCDWRVSSLMRLVMDEVFGRNYFVNEIVWAYKTGGVPESVGFSKKHDTILFYSKSDRPIFNGLEQKSYVPTLPEPHTNSGKKLGVQRDEICDLCGVGSPGQKYRMVKARDVWDDIPSIFRNDSQVTGYDTQKPEALLDRLVRASSNEGDIVADFFCGSGTTAAVAEKLGRKWIVADLGKFAIHTTRKRMIEVQRQAKAEQRTYRAFEILNLGKYERQHFIGVNPNLREEEQRRQLESREAVFLQLILHAYRAEPVTGFQTFHGRRAGRLVSIGPVNLPVTRAFVEEVIHECREKHITKVDIVAFEFEMGLFPNVLEDARASGIDIRPKYIPKDVFDKRAVERNQLSFHDVAYVEVKVHTAGNKLAVELTDFSVFYAQDSIAEAESSLRNRGSKIVVDQGRIVKVEKDKDGIVTRHVLTQHWADWIDYWSVDFNFESKQEMVHMQDVDTGEWRDVWTGNYVFENEWQSFRTRRDRSLELVSVFRECSTGPRTLAVKVVDIFGNDTMKVIRVNVGVSAEPGYFPNTV